MLSLAFHVVAILFIDAISAASLLLANSSSSINGEVRNQSIIISDDPNASMKEAAYGWSVTSLLTFFVIFVAVVIFSSILCWIFHRDFCCCCCYSPRQDSNIVLRRNVAVLDCDDKHQRGLSRS